MLHSRVSENPGMKTSLSSFALLLFFALNAGAAPAPDGLEERLAAHARTVSAEDYAYTRTVWTESVGRGKTEERTVIERWDPTQPPEQRWKLISIDGQPPSAGQLQDYRKGLTKRRQAHYGRIAGYFAKPATRATNAQGRTVFRFASLPKETIIFNDADVSANATGEAVLNSAGAVPFIEEVRFTSTRPSRIKLVAKIERFETFTRYRLMPDGKPVPAELRSEMVGSMLGQEGSIRTRIVYSDYRALPK